MKMQQAGSFPEACPKQAAYHGKEGGVTMPKCGICGGEAPKQPCITEEGKCDLCDRKVVLEEDKKKS